MHLGTYAYPYCTSFEEMTDIPYRYERSHDTASLRAAFDDLEAGAETGEIVSVAGRLMLNRPQGKLAFSTLADSSGRIQLMAQSGKTDRFEELGKLSIGDWIGVRGEVIKTRKGELSVRVHDWAVLAHTLRPFPDKWHGLTDVDTRYRQRYLDLWVTEEARAAALLRIRMTSLIRRWLEDRGFIEVETPLLHTIPGGALAKPFQTHYNSLDIDVYLRIAIELHLKRLVVGGFEKVFEIGRTFRNEGISPRHQPEFTMLELYEAYADLHDMMELMEQLVAHLAQELKGTTVISYQGKEMDLTPPWRRASMLDLIEEHAGVRLGLTMPFEELRRVATEHGVVPEPDWGPGKLILEVYEKTTEANLWGPIFVTDYPKEVSPLARDHRELPGMVERFEPIFAGREIGNAFSELNDPIEQRLRFEDQAKVKATDDEDPMPLDEDYVRALEYGMPPTGGLGIGLDRLAMLLADVDNIRDVVLFPTLRPEQS